jgi:hypothetical protein
MFGDTATGTWTSNELLGYERREESRKEFEARKPKFVGISKTIENLIEETETRVEDAK